MNKELTLNIDEDNLVQRSSASRYIKDVATDYIKNQDQNKDFSKEAAAVLLELGKMRRSGVLAPRYFVDFLTHAQDIDPSGMNKIRESVLTMAVRYAEMMQGSINDWTGKIPESQIATMKSYIVEMADIADAIQIELVNMNERWIRIF